MTDDDALIARLDRAERMLNAMVDGTMKWIVLDGVRAGLEAADRIAALTAEQERLRIVVREDGAELDRLRAGWKQAEAERDAIYRFARLNGLAAIDIQNAIDAALAAQANSARIPALPSSAPPPLERIPAARS